MSTSDTPTVNQAIINVMEDVGAVGKDSVNTGQGYKFRGIDAIVAAIQPALIRHGVTIIPRIISHKSENREGINGQGRATIARFCTVEVKYTITGPAGDSIDAVMVGEANDTADKAMNKALSAAAKYFYNQTFWLPVAVDDGDADHFEQGGYTQSAPAPQQSGGNLANKVASAAGRPASAPAAPRAGGGISDKQAKAVWAISHRGLGWDDARMFDEIEVVCGVRVGAIEDLTSAQARVLIDALKQRENGGAPASEPMPEPPAYDPGMEEF
jgi:hypothetical protein